MRCLPASKQGACVRLPLFLAESGLGHCVDLAGEPFSVSASDFWFLIKLIASHVFSCGICIELTHFQKSECLKIVSASMKKTIRSQKKLPSMKFCCTAFFSRYSRVFSAFSEARLTFCSALSANLKPCILKKRSSALLPAQARDDE